ncbi:hypothetical protein Agub_g26, partial [Astrephomene gubernaculifera]
MAAASPAEPHSESFNDRSYADWLARAEAKMAAKAKPPGSLGTLETLACRLAALQHTLEPRVGRTYLLVFGADHGITAARPEISAYPRQVSAPIFKAIVRGQAASAVLCAANALTALLAVDVGLDADVTGVQPPPPLTGLEEPAWSRKPQIAVLHRKVRPQGSRNMLEGPAMTEEELAAALQAGADAVQTAVRGRPGPAGAEQGCAVHEGSGSGNGDVGNSSGGGGGCAGRGDALPDDWRRCVLCIGEVGIGNTTAAAALLAALTGASPEDVCGRGTGVDDAGLAAKRAAVEAALAANEGLLAAGGGGGGGGALRALRAVGGLELAGMAGAVLEAARLGLPVVADGFISGCAALAALAHQPRPVGRVLLLSHRSAERGAAVLLAALTGATPLAPHVAAHQQQEQERQEQEQQEQGAQQEPHQQEAAVAAAAAGGGIARAGPCARPTPAVLDMGMRLGEGTGAVLVLPLLRAAVAVLRDMASLEQVLA